MIDPLDIITEFTPDFAIAYGSGAMEQQNYSMKRGPMIDFIFGVQEVAQWHLHNMGRRPQDYSLWAKQHGINAVEQLQEEYTGIYYNPFVKFEDKLIKYGVISEEALIKDLTEWNSLYVAGRMHKPFLSIKTNELVNQAQEKNLAHAVNTALLVLPEAFSYEDLFLTIAGLSYHKDNRMKFAENKNKVQHIVEKNYDAFYKQYIPLLSNYDVSITNEIIRQDKSPQTLQHLLLELPQELKRRVSIKTTLYPTTYLQNEKLATPDEIATIVLESIGTIVYTASKAQTKKGIKTAGIPKAVRYGLAKVGKGMKSKIAKDMRLAKRVERQWK
ncbi:phosphatidate cytidylyltransferase [Candidatus Woesearchaeota archaeon]|nr:phosphatidate cytidylyltransferase [Candidatus Woesearchaeota archaeon]